MFGEASASGSLICFLRDPKARRTLVGALLLMKELAVSLVVTPELLGGPAISGAAYGRLGIHQHTSHHLKFDETVGNA